jgi:hypothetical protein
MGDSSIFRVKKMPDQRGKTVSVYLDLDLEKLVVAAAKNNKWSKSQFINEIVREYFVAKGLAADSFEESEAAKK